MRVLWQQGAGSVCNHRGPSFTPPHLHTLLTSCSVFYTYERLGQDSDGVLAELRKFVEGAGGKVDEVHFHRRCCWGGGGGAVA